LCEFVPTNAAGSAQASSAATGVVAARSSSAPVNTGLPTVSGPAVEGEALSASTGWWSGSPTSYSYQWQRCDASGEGCTNVSGASSSSYTLAAGDVGHTLRVLVTATNAGGSGQATSAVSGVVVAAGGSSCTFTVGRLSGVGGAEEDLRKSGSPVVCLEEGVYEGPMGRPAGEENETNPAVYGATEVECEEPEWRRQCWTITTGPSSGVATLRPVPGAKVVIVGLVGLDASDVTLEGLTVRGPVRVGWHEGSHGPSENDTLRDVVGRRFLVWGAHYLTIEGGEWGPSICDKYDDNRSYRTKVEQDGEAWPTPDGSNNKLQHQASGGGNENEHVTIKGSVFRGVQAYQYEAEGGGAECHTEALAVFGGNFVTVTENKFYEDAVYDMFIQNNTGGKVDNLVVSKNWMAATQYLLNGGKAGQEAAEGSGGAGLGNVQNALTDEAHENLEFVANHVHSASQFYEGTSTNVRVADNFSGLDYETIAYCSMYKGVTFEKNVWTKLEHSKLCGREDQALGAEPLPFVNHEDNRNLNYTLTGPYTGWPE